MMLPDAGASKEAPFLVEADAPSDSPEEAQPYVYPPHLDGLRCPVPLSLCAPYR
jgi:hypothetical protein